MLYLYQQIGSSFSIWPNNLGMTSSQIAWQVASPSPLKTRVAAAEGKKDNAFHHLSPEQLISMDWFVMSENGVYPQWNSHLVGKSDH